MKHGQLVYSRKKCGWHRLVKEAGIPIKLPDDMELLRSKAVYEVNRILEEGQPEDFWRILRYLKRLIYRLISSIKILRFEMIELAFFSVNAQ